MNPTASIDAVITTASFYHTIIDRMMNAFALHKIILDDKGEPCNYEFLTVNPAFEQMTGLKKETIVGKKITEVIPAIKSDKVNWIEIYGKVALNCESISFESYSEALERWYTINAYCPKQGYFITVFNDISRLKKGESDLREKNTALSASEERLRHMAEYDPLTGLPNLSSFYMDMYAQLSAAPDSRMALLYIDSDNYKLINGRLGHPFGEMLILAVQKRLTTLFHSNYPIYALSGAEFIICLNDFSSQTEVEACAEKIIQSFEAPFQLKGNKLHMTTSIGIAGYPENGANPDELLKNAHMALYIAKQKGKNRYAFYDSDMHCKLDRQLNIERLLHTAMENHEFSIHYQPQLDLHTNEICGFEALLRWNSPELGSVSPSDFIQIAEYSHLIIPIGKWVLRNACYFIKKLQIRGCPGFVVSVNVSVLQLLQEDYVDTVLTQLALIELDPRYLELEITESMLIESYEIIYRKLEILRSHGIKIAMDDFGKGFSSLSGLQSLPIDILKVDKVFIDSIVESSRSSCIADMIIQIGKRMGLRVLAEGVETQEQLDYLIRNGCDVIQGYLFSKPVPEEKIPALIGSCLEKSYELYGFDWKDDYSIGIENIDVQHKKLFELGKRLSELVFSIDYPINGGQIENILMELKSYTTIHFRYEESLMRMHGYAYLENHINEHAALIVKVNKVNKEFDQYALKDFYMYLIDFISVWITNHILKEDMKFGEFVSNL